MHSPTPADTPPDEQPAAPLEVPQVEAAAPEASESPTPSEPAKAAAPAAAEMSPAACGARLAELFPALFVAPGAPGPVKPIKLRIHADIQARAPGLFSKRVLGPFFGRYTTTNAYLKALTAPGAQRFDLDGQPAGDIAEEHRLAAAEELARRHAVAAERRAAQRQAQPAPRGTTEQPPPRAPRPPRQDGAPRQGNSRRDEPPRGMRAPRDSAARANDDRPRGPRQHEPAGPPQGRIPEDAARRHSNERDRSDRAPRHDPRPERRPAPTPDAAAVAMPADPAQRERALLLRSFESSPLSKANFCALKRIDEATLDAALAQARQEREQAARGRERAPADRRG